MVAKVSAPTLSSVKPGAESLPKFSTSPGQTVAAAADSDRETASVTGSVPRPPAKAPSAAYYLTSANL